LVLVIAVVDLVGWPETREISGTGTARYRMSIANWTSSVAELGPGNRLFSVSEQVDDLGHKNE
jgi:hypothetical protein